MGKRWKWCRTYHVIMLQPWYEKGETSLWVEEEKENEVDESEIVIWDKEITVGALTLGADLSGQQKGQLEGLLYEYGDMMSGIPGKTNLVSHTASAGTAQPMRLAPYRVSQVY